MFLAVVAPASAQTPAPAPPVTAPTPGPPGRYVVDVRGTTTGIPTSGAFFPDLPTATTVPARGFGFDIGGHVYPWQLGPSRVGLGASIARARGSVAATTAPAGSTLAASPGVVTTITTVAPQISFNFGTEDGWSYLSAGYGTGQVKSKVTSAANGVSSLETTSSGTLRSVNIGGGARWFLSSHVAVGFDVRMHRMAAGRAGGTPAATVISASVGLSLR